MAVDKIRFSLMSPKEMIHAAVIECTHQELYTVSNGFVPIPGGVLDLRLGTSNKVIVPAFVLVFACSWSSS